MKKSVIISDKDIMGGTPVFAGTRVPVQYLFERLEGGETVNEFVESYPTVTKKQAKEAIKLAEKLIEKLMTQSENSSR
ncbi:MAG: DUF433 domain-containing protein [Bacteroidota bacterium]